MTMQATYEFRAVMPTDLAMLNAWRGQSHVAAWWGDGEYTVDDLSDYRVSRFIVQQKGQPFAFMQDYTVHGWPEHHFAHLPVGSRGIDQFIGVPDMLGQGHGTAFIGQRMRDIFDAGAPVIATDPHPDNAWAIATYHKVGFVPAGKPAETRWGLIQPMLAKR